MKILFIGKKLKVKNEIIIEGQWLYRCEAVYLQFNCNATISTLL